MKVENEEILFKLAPKLYKNIKYIDCGDGWFDLIKELSEKLEKEIESLSTEEQENVYAIQVKEKFGSLRFYMSQYTLEITNLIAEADSKSTTICTECSDESNIIGRSWLYNLCEKCYVRTQNHKHNNCENQARQFYRTINIDES
jgi:thymidine kinase